MSDLKIKQISNRGASPDSYVAFNGTSNVWQKIRHTQAFQAMDLTAGVLTVHHNLGHKYVNVAIYDETDHQVLPDQVKVIDTSIAEITLTSFVNDISDWIVVVT